MIEEDVWNRLTTAEKADELARALDVILQIKNGQHELIHTRAQGGLAAVAKAAKAKVVQITSLVNGNF